MANRIVSGSRAFAAAAEFFYETAGYSYRPGAETAEQGRRRCARSLACAEATAAAIGVSYTWKVDDETSASFSDARPAWRLWLCVAELDGLTEALGGVDFGREGDPRTAQYARVVEAELAAELIAGLTRSGNHA